MTAMSSDSDAAIPWPNPWRRYRYTEVCKLACMVYPGIPDILLGIPFRVAAWANTQQQEEAGWMQVLVAKNDECMNAYSGDGEHVYFAVVSHACWKAYNDEVLAVHHFPWSSSPELWSLLVTRTRPPSRFCLADAFS